MPKVPELTGLMGSPAGARQGRVEYSQVRPDQTTAKMLDGADEKAFALMGLQAREDAKAKAKADAEAEKAKKAMARARADELLQKYTLAGQKYLLDKDGPLRQEGLKVVKGVDGVAFSEYHQGYLRNLAAEIESEAEGDTEVLSLLRDGIRGAYGKFSYALINHEGEQGRAYVVSTQENKTALAKTDFEALPTTDSANELKRQMFAEVSLKGGNPNDPYVKKSVSTAIGEGFSAGVAARIKNGDLAGARAIYLEGKASGLMTFQQALNAHRALSVAQDAEDATFVGQQVAAEVELRTSPSSVLFSSIFGSAETEAPASLFEATGTDLEEARRRGYGTNPSYTAAVNASLIDKVSADTGTPEEAIGVVLLGKSRVEEAKSEAEKEYGNAALWSKKLTREEFTKIDREHQKVLLSDDMSVSEADLRKRIREMTPGRSVEMQEAAFTKALDDMQNRAAQRKQDREVGIAMALDSVDNNQELTPASLGAYSNVLTQKDHEMLRLYRRRSVSNDTTTDFRFYTTTIRDPYSLKNKSESDIRLMKAFLGPKQYDVVYRQWKALQGVESLSGMTLTRDQVRAETMIVLREIAPKLAAAKDDTAKMRLESIVDRVYLTTEGMLRARAGTLEGDGGVKFSPKELREAVRDQLTTIVKTPGGLTTSGENINITNLKIGALPSWMVGMAKDIAGKKGVADPSDNTVLNIVTGALTYPEEDPAVDLVMQSPTYGRYAEAARLWYADAYMKSAGVSREQAREAADSLTGSQVLKHITELVLVKGERDFTGIIKDTYPSLDNRTLMSADYYSY